VANGVGPDFNPQYHQKKKKKKKKPLLPHLRLNVASQQFFFCKENPFWVQPRMFMDICHPLLRRKTGFSF
jgi:hypothetical protein